MVELFEIDFRLGMAVFISIPVFLTALVAFFYFLDNYFNQYRKLFSDNGHTDRQLRCRIAYFSERGARKRQEDSYYISPLRNASQDGVVAVVADGIGGLKYGDDIAKLVTNGVGDNFPYVFDDPETNSTILRGISRNIYNHYHLEGGATLAMVHIRNNYMNMYSCGDSNIILVRDDKAYILNPKQNYLSVLVERHSSLGETTKSAYLDKDAKALVDFMGNSYSRVTRTFRPVRLYDGDYVIVSSDGLTDAIPLEKIPEYLHKRAVSSAERLKFTVRSSRRPSQDNYTAVIIRMEYDIV
ncbi:Serine/threonine protein phosphatase PrpC [Ruminococcaceae bacterium YRB3002]|nr:Serine/threonine protein phosphatase PrpC [Ruminococcaceae bacterium YRB3002]